MGDLKKFAVICVAIAATVVSIGAAAPVKQAENSKMMEARNEIIAELIAAEGVNKAIADMIYHSDEYKETGESAMWWTNRMAAAFEIAEMARGMGVSEDDQIIATLQDIFEQEYRDLQMVAKTISREAAHCPYWHMVAVGAVVMNRVSDARFPDTVYEVLIAPRQYSVSYTHDFTDISEEHYLAAIDAMNGEHDVPTNVVYQAEFFQGGGIWKTSPVWTPYYSSVTYFCY